jgi:hypothetical protein
MDDMQGRWAVSCHQPRRRAKRRTVVSEALVERLHNGAALRCNRQMRGAASLSERFALRQGEAWRCAGLVLRTNATHPVSKAVATLKDPLGAQAHGFCGGMATMAVLTSKLFT